MCEKGYHIPFATGPKLYALCILDDKSGLRGQRRPPQARSPRATTSLYNKSNFLYSKGSINLNGFTGYRHKIQEGDFAVILDSLQELFRERGDSVTPKQLAERMEHKLNRSVPNDKQDWDVDCTHQPVVLRAGWLENIKCPYSGLYSRFG